MQETMQTDPQQLAGIYDELESATRSLLQEQEVSDTDITVTREVGMCYVGQSYQLRVPMTNKIDSVTNEKLSDFFHASHAEHYGFSNENEATQIVNLRVLGIGKVDRPVLRKLDAAKDSPKRAVKGVRKVYFSDESEMIEVELYDRENLLAGDMFKGPAIIEQMDTTVVIPKNSGVEVEEFGNIIISLNNE